MPTDDDPTDLEQTYRLLARGVGRERVNEDNVAALIRRAEQDGHAILATELREWASGCGRAAPSTVAPTPGFNRQNVKR